MKRIALRKQRERQGLSQERAAHAMGVAVSTYRAWEAGTKVPRVGFRPRLARLLDVSLTTVDGYLDGRDDPATNAQQVPTWLTLHASLEQGASHVWVWQPLVIDGLLQTATYAAAVERVDAVPKSDEGIARRVEARLTRQRVLTRESSPLHLSAILDESTLYRVTGDQETMAEQLRYLVEMAALPNVDLRFLPLDVGQYSAAFGSFTMIDTQGINEPQIVVVEDRTGVRYLEGPHGVDAHRQVFEHLRSFALSGDDSVDLIDSIRKERYHP